MKKLYFKRLAITAFLVSVISAGTLMAQTYSGGSGTKADPFQIATVQDLLDLDTARTHWASKYWYQLTADIDMKDTAMTPIGVKDGSTEYGFTGSFDGNNHVIKNVRIKDTYGASNMGFFGIFYGDTIMNLGIDSIIVAPGSGERQGALAGVLASAYVSNCFVIRGVVKGGGRIGALAGMINNNARVVNCLVEVDVTGGWARHGMVGNFGMFWDVANATNKIDSCANYGTVNGGFAIADTTGNNQTHNCYYVAALGTDENPDNVQMTATEAVLQATYANLDFTNIWVMKTGGYAVLKSFPISAFDNLLVPENKKPIAEAGIAQTVALNSTVQLDASASNDPEGEDITFLWKAPAGVTLSDVADTNPTFTASPVGKHIFKLVVNDGVLDSDTATVEITVVDDIPTDTLKNDMANWVADGNGFRSVDHIPYGIDGDFDGPIYSTDWEDPSLDFPFWYSVDLGGRSAEITHFIYYPRQDEYGPNGTIREYEFYVSNSKDDWGTAVAADTFDYPIWIEEGIPTKDKYFAPKLVKLATPVTGKHVRLLSVRSINSDIDPLKPRRELTMGELILFGQYVVVPNTAPVADAGPDQTVESGATVTLDGSGSSDVDNDPLAYTWTAPAGITLTDGDKVGPTFTAPTVSDATTYEIELVVNDGTEDSPVDKVVITVNPSDGLVSIQDINVSVYPNPSNGEFTVVSESVISVDVKDVLGRTLKTDNFGAGNNTLDITEFGEGLYILTVKEGNKVATLKLRVL